MDNQVLSIETSKYLLLRQRLLADFPGIDLDTLGDSLEGITNLQNDSGDYPVSAS